MLKFKTNESIRNNIGTFISYDLAITIFLIVLVYFTAGVAVMEDALVLHNYANIFKFISLLSLIIFTVFSTVLYFHFVMKDRSDDKPVLFSPSFPQKSILPRMLVVLGFTTISMVICTMIPIMVFITTESFIQITPDKLSLNVIMLAMSNIIILSPIAGITGFVAIRIGFVRKSISFSIFTTLTFVILIGHIFANAYDNLLIRISMLLFVMLIGLLTLHNSIKKSRS